MAGSCHAQAFRNDQPLYKVRADWDPHHHKFKLTEGHASFNLTKIDVLDGLPTIKAAIAYCLPDGR